MTISIVQVTEAGNVVALDDVLLWNTVVVALDVLLWNTVVSV